MNKEIKSQHHDNINKFILFHIIYTQNDTRKFK